MKKLSFLLIALLVASVVFNVIQYNKYKDLEERVGIFKDAIGLTGGLPSKKEIDEAKKKKENIINIVFQSDVAVSKVLDLKNLIEKEEVVQSVQYVSAEQALLDFKNKNQNNRLVLQSLEESGNPFGASLVITISDVSKKQTLIDFIKTKSGDNDSSIIYLIS